MDLSSEMNRAELETEEKRLREMRYQNYKARVMSSISRLSRHQLTFVRDYEYENSHIARESMQLSAKTIKGYEERFKAMKLHFAHWEEEHLGLDSSVYFDATRRLPENPLHHAIHFLD